MKSGGVVASRADDIATFFDGGEAVRGLFGLVGPLDGCVSLRDGIVAIDDCSFRSRLGAFNSDLIGTAVGSAGGEEEGCGGEDDGS